MLLYARGLSTRDSSAQLEELYGVSLSPSLISEVTDSVSEAVKAWQCRPLDEVYPMLYLDALSVNIKVSGRVSKRAVYVVLGINRDGNKELLGLWIGEAETEGAKFWLKVLTDLKKQRVEGYSDCLLRWAGGLPPGNRGTLCQNPGAIVYRASDSQLSTLRSLEGC